MTATPLGGNVFDVGFPVVIGDRYVQVEQDPLRGPLVSVYRWDRSRDEVLAELVRGQPVAEGPPLTVDPAGGAGAVRLRWSDTGGVVGYIAGGADARSVVIGDDGIRAFRGNDEVFAMLSSTVAGFDVGIRIDGDAVSIGGGVPDGFPRYRTLRGAQLAMASLVSPMRHLLAYTIFDQCDLYGPAVLVPVGPNVALARCEFMTESPNVILELADETQPPVGAIGLGETRLSDCKLFDIALLQRRGTRESTLSGLGFQ